MIKLALSGLDALLRKTNGNLVSREIETMVDDTGKVVQDALEENSPRDTGNLAGSWQLDASADRAEVSTPVPYARYQDQGTSRGVTAKRFVTAARAKAIDQSREIVNRAEKRIEKAWSK